MEDKKPQQPAPVQPSRDDWERVVRPQRKKGRRLTYAAVFAVIFIAAFAAFSFSGSSITGLFISGGASRGDTVKVEYTGMLENGEVFDTTVQARGEAAGIERYSYEPLEFTLGTESVIQGFEEAILGMKPGEKKTVTITPDKGYGEPDPTLIQKLSRVQELDREETIPLVLDVPADFFVKEFGPKQVGDTFTQEESGLEYQVLSIGEDSYTIKLIVEEGGEYKLPGNPWSGTIIEIMGDEAVLRYNPDLDEVSTGYGTASITYTDDKITITHNPIVGKKIETPLGVATISGLDEENITIDMNHFLAGKNLIFEIELLEIM